MFSGFETKHVDIDTTVLIDSEKYNAIFQTLRNSTDESLRKECADPENEVYEKCGSKCVLGCRNSFTSLDIAVAKGDCEKASCVEGCFCKEGLVRNRGVCIPATECSIRKHKAVEFMQPVSMPATRHFGLFNRQPLVISNACGPSGCFSNCGPNGCGSYQPEVYYQQYQPHFSGCGPRGCGNEVPSCGPNGCGPGIHIHNTAVGGKKSH